MTAQFIRQREGDHKIGSTDTFAEFSFHPFCGGILAALRAGPVVARMKVELAGAAWRAGMNMPAHFRRAAMGNRPDGASLRPVEQRSSTQKRGQESAQHVDDCSGHAAGGVPDDLTWQIAAEFVH